MQVITRARLGDVLVDEEWITAEQRDWALAIGEQSGVRLGAVLVAAGLMRRADLYRVLARLWDCGYVDLAETSADHSLLDGLDPQVLADEGWFPVRRLEHPNGRHAADRVPAVLVATAEQPTDERRRRIEQRLDAPVVLQVTTDWDIIEALHLGYRQDVVDQATLGLWRRDSTQSARAVLLRSQRILLGALLAGLVVGLVLAPMPTLTTLTAVISVAYLLAVLFKFVVCMVGVRQENRVAVSDEEVAALDARELPTYTVLVPVYREANVVADLIANLGALDYPPAKLEILLLLEENDTETIEAARAADPPETIRFLIVPPGHPQTKPKACNVGLFLARGEYLVIYDAEDKPDPDQLKKAVIAFERGGDRLVCVQAALNYWNAEDNWLTRMFTVEYSFWFDYMLPGLDRLRLPIPLGGTSNHFRTEALRRLGGWDPFNVTEDADLGIRAAVLGSTVGVINSTTYEEANRAPGNWVRQRSRWIKGYLQTLLVHLRQPGSLLRTAGLRQTAAFALLVGGTPMTFLFTPPLYALFLASLLLPPTVFSGLFPGWVLWVALFNLIIGNGLMIYVSMMGAFKRRRYALVLWALLNPVYWLLHSAAAYKALWQLITKPHYWEKTLHGLSHAAPTGLGADPAASAVAG
jgi:cellulose synthase/poly-beta-1,6-N-acetylglucosamine synthase-like glycosyltransferase